MTRPGLPQPGCKSVEWVRRVNARWLVHDGLEESARRYLDHLAATDWRRLEASCRVARLLVGEGAPAEDPKPRFYGGLFCLATDEEAERFLGAHPFLASLRAGAEPCVPFGEATRLRNAALRAEIARARERIAPDAARRGDRASTDAAPRPTS